MRFGALGRIVGVVAGLTTIMTLASPISALAAPTNNDFANATVIGVLPFSDSVNSTTATSQPGEPQCFFPSEVQTVWYSFTPAVDEVLRADTAGSSFFDTSLSTWVGSGLGDLSNVGGCQTFGNPLIFAAQAGTTYFFRVAAAPFSAGGDLHFNLRAVPPPPNDDFANATTINALPFSNTVDATAATLETGEPTPSCGFGAPSGTVWYAFTPGTSGSVSANVNASSNVVAAYTGTSLTSLTDLGCRSFGSVLTIHVDAGQTYYFQTGGLFGQRGTLTFNLIVTPPPQANFFFSPSDPSIFDIIQFFDQSFDPGNVGFTSEAWDFGDGTTATGCCPTHRYAADADYSVMLTVTTLDGRMASTSRLVHVKTHDVAITKFLVPQAANVGQTRMISAGISTARYPETVQVQLLKSVPGSFDNFVLVGTLTQSVPVLPGNRTTPFDFNYTFTSDDAAAGKVTFKAVATVIGSRDAQSGDNTVVALPTVVKP